MAKAPPVAITVDLVLGAGWLSRAIAWYGTGYNGLSHAAPRLRDGTYIDARSDWITTTEGRKIPPGIQERPAQYETWKRHLRASLPCSLAAYSRWEQELRNGIGQGYDKADILGFLLGVPLTEGDGHWICSGWTAAKLEARGLLKPNPFVPWRQVTPNSLLIALNQAGFAITDITKEATAS